ncbi:MAG: 2-amino-4-hydroxy-6-hydroxymethyldihydropteridine diphosphokinase [Gammaproteobacteria bacterium]|nr:2-amino-4-hydroxy-6-hydroxymethyldihydropteridine diphosphokinase [Gammaproteobacteria bacterium]
MTYCLLGLGSNLHHPMRQLGMAIAHIKQLPSSIVLEVAPYFRNKAWGKSAVPDYYNTVLLLKTRLSPLRLLACCQQIEKQQYRSRRTRHAARTIDIDILKYGSVILRAAVLTLPHPRMHERAFVQIPLAAMKNRRLNEWC